MPVYQLDEHDLWFPPVSEAEQDPQGLLAIGGDLSVPRLLYGYQCGIFPWFSEQDPILWWAPSPRMVVAPSKVHISKSMKKFIRSTPLEVTYDQAFERVVNACASVPRGQQLSQESWITQSMQAAYTNLYQGGYAHSVEVWSGASLVGGLYGVAIGRLFFGESMFSKSSNASKLAFIHLAESLKSWGFVLIDCQMHTPHLESMGATEIEMSIFQKYLGDNEIYGLESNWNQMVKSDTKLA